MKPNVVFVTLDCFRSDALGCYNNHSVKTPNIDLLASRGVVVEKAYTHCPLTGPAHLSLFGSKLPFEHGLRFNARKVELPSAYMPSIFKDNGYKTGAAVAAVVFKRRYGFDKGFDYYDDAMLSSRFEAFALKAFRYSKEWGGERLIKTSRNANRVTNSAIKWLKALGNQRPFFLWLHYFDAHDQFRLPRLLHLYYFRRRSYEQSVEYIDRQLGRLIDHLKKKNELENTLFVIFGDHGEALNDRYAKGVPYRGHSLICSEVTLRIPLIFSGCGVKRGLRTGQVFRMIDILPTTLDLINGIDTDKTSFSGISLVDHLKKEDTPKHNPEVYAETWVPTVHKLPEQKVLIRLPWKYMRAGKEFLYNLSDDPEETRNIIDDNPEIAEKMRRRLEEMTKGDKGPEQPDWDEKTKLQLKALGYM